MLARNETTDTAATAISGFVVCENASRTIRRCIESLDFCREIVVVDSGSTDGTLEILEAMRGEGYPVRLIRRAWPGYALQKQFALDTTEGPWCISLDSDEYLDDGLRREIMALPLPDSSAAGYWMRRRDRLPGYGYPPTIVHARYMLRLVHKGRASFDTTQLVHEALSAEGGTARLKGGFIMHERDMSVSAESALMNKYSTLKARDAFARGVRTGPIRLTFTCIWEFIKTCFGQRYILCGSAGVIHALMRAEYVLLTECKLYRLSQGSDAPPEPE